jgi:hypothetical protein
MSDAAAATETPFAVASRAMVSSASLARSLTDV